MTASSPRRSSSTDLALIAGFGALVAVCAVLPSINVAGPVPITLQTFGLLLAGAVLGARRGFLAVLLYLAVGAAGLPVFAGGTAGLGVFSGPTVGYLVSFPFAAGLCGLVVERLPRRAIQTSVPLIFLATVAGVLLNHALGMAGLVWRLDISWAAAFDIDKVFWIGDLLKGLLVAVVATAVHRAFPDLLGRRPGRRDTAPADGPTGGTTEGSPENPVVA
ncbi:biotin transporter BioY [Nocardioides panaciterrulae]|uniref:Biotin transporter n=1 Tax=Nocardioides panaciterrulae TaxID=661492 RepID=A0A7Y9JBS2_9ACTN|nr:biotin transporter BioY [Nocardioides panaciterrulae]NYD42486.1 biotin transport system substrate-specific component [Nocardioides panaciterrulae]